MTKKLKRIVATLDKKMLRCRWCGAQPVPLKRGRLASHLNGGGLKCIGIGQKVQP